MAVDGVDGLPAQFDFLIGDEYVKLASGHFANLGAESFAVAIPPLLTFPVDGSTGSRVALLFDGICYHPAPRVLADDNIPSPTDGNNTLLVVNRFGGDLSSTAGTIGNIFDLVTVQPPQRSKFEMRSE